MPQITGSFEPDGRSVLLRSMATRTQEMKLGLICMHKHFFIFTHFKILILLLYTPKMSKFPVESRLHTKRPISSLLGPVDSERGAIKTLPRGQ